MSLNISHRRLENAFLSSVVAIGVPLLVFAVVYTTNNVETSVLCAVAAACTSIMIAAALWLGEFQLDSPIVLCGFSIFLGTTMRSLHLTYFRSESTAYLLMSREIESILPGAFIVLFSTIALLAGYVPFSLMGIGTSKSVPNAVLARPWNPSRVYWLVLFCSIVGIVATLDYLRKSGTTLADVMSLGEFSLKRRGKADDGSVLYLGYNGWAMSLLPCAYFLILITALSEKRTRLLQWLLVAISGASSVLAYLVIGNRITVLFLILSSVLVYRRFRTVSMVGVTAAFSIAIVLFLVSGAIRNGELKDVEDLWVAFEPVKILDRVLGTHNHMDVTRTSHIYEAVPNQIDYQYGKTLLGIFIAPIPREIWPEKPIGVQHEIRDLVYGAVRDTGVVEIGNVPPGIIGEMIINFGLWGVAPGMFIYGAALAYFRNSLYPKLREGPGYLWMYTMVLPFATIYAIDLDVTSILSFLGRLVVNIYVFAWISGTFVKRKVVLPAGRVTQPT